MTPGLGDLSGTFGNDTLTQGGDRNDISGLGSITFGNSDDNQGQLVIALAILLGALLLSKKMK